MWLVDTKLGFPRFFRDIYAELLNAKERANWKKHIDIYILYWTAGVDGDKNIFFERDVYNRDASVLKALNKPVVFKKVN